MSTATPKHRPGSVTWSFVIWIIGAILSLISAVILFIIGAAGGTAVAVSGAPAAGIIIMVAGAFALVIGILELIVVVKMRAGRNWARVLLTVFTILQILGAFSQGGSNSWSSWASFALVIIATILMYVPASNAYFSHKSTGAEPIA